MCLIRREPKQLIAVRLLESGRPVCGPGLDQFRQAGRSAVVVLDFLWTWIRSSGQSGFRERRKTTPLRRLTKRAGAATRRPSPPN